MDQARVGGWSVFDNDSKQLVDCGEYDFGRTSMTYASAVESVKQVFAGLIRQYQPGMVLLEDIQFRANAETYKKLAWLQGTLINYGVENELPFWLVQPAKWQAWCKKHCVPMRTDENISDKKASKQLSIHYVHQKYDISTTNDNLADAICIGSYGVNANDIEFVEK